MTLNDDLILYIDTALAMENATLERVQSRIQKNNFGRCEAAITASFRGNKKTSRSIKTSNYKNRWHTHKRKGWT
jgi:hypothetical protein